MNATPADICRYAAQDLGLSPESISPQALEVVEALQSNGYETYVVGGSIRDLLLGRHPKDFDIATAARPEQIIRCFPRSKCRVIGRRFKIVHVRFGRHITEVSTFRALPDADADNRQVVMRDGLIIRDNQYGSLEEDVLRRDFTINSMYYDPFADEVVSHPQAMEDVEQRQLRFIGPASERCREDPVRMIRALRLTAKNDLQLVEDVKQSILSMSGQLRNISSARLFEENVKWMHGGFAYRSWQLMCEYGLAEVLFPAVMDCLRYDNGGKYKKLLEVLFQNTDKRVAQGKSVTPAFTITTMLWQVIADKQQEIIDAGDTSANALYEAYYEVMEMQREYLAVPHRLLHAGREICMLQHRLMSQRRKALYNTLEHPRFRAAYDLLCCRAEAGLADSEQARWWTQIQEVDNAERDKMINRRARVTNSVRRPTRHSIRGQGR